MEQEPLGVCNPLVIRKEVFTSAIGFVAATPVLFVTLLIFLAALNPISNSNVGRASKEQQLPFLLEMILTFYGIMSIIA
jgi:hypothetical protein